MINIFYLIYSLLVLHIRSSIFRYKAGHINIKPNLNDKILFKFFKSNHPNRIYAFYNYLLLKQKNLNAGKFIPENYNKINNKKNKILLFCGDSHVEFYSRLKNSYAENNLHNIKSFAVWFGHLSLLTNHYSKQEADFYSLINQYIECINLKTKDELNFIFSLGDTDIRFIFYKSIKLGLFKNFDDLKKKYHKILELFINKLIKKILIKYPNSNIYFLDVLNNDSSGKIFNNLEKLKIYNLQNSFALLGTNDEYKNWTREINLSIKEICKKNNITNLAINEFINSKYLNNNLKKQNLSLDGVHIMSNEIINKIFKQIIHKK